VVGAPAGLAARIEIAGDFAHEPYCYILRQVGVKRPLYRLRLVARLCVEGCDLPAGMDAGIGAAGKCDGGRSPEECGSRGFEFALDGARRWLAL